jgi:lipopolysaccharide/colanic/teichoic acid biosynthesis glycosyltransferase
MDVSLSALALIILLPVLLIVSLAIKLDSKGPVFFVQERAGKHGVLFKMYKFRSMSIMTELLEDLLTDEQLMQYYTEFKIDNDPRVTRIGRFIRKTSIDELPQILNIIRGDMSIIGPRPVIKPELRNYDAYADEFLSVKPGLTGYWQAYARSDVGYEHGKRQEMELHYVRNRSFIFDVKIFLKTIVSVIIGRGAK